MRRIARASVLALAWLVLASAAAAQDTPSFFVTGGRSSSTEISPAPPGVIFPRSETSSVSYGTAAVVGLDVPVRVARQVDLVPQIRAQSTGGPTIRPGISGRVRF